MIRSQAQFCKSFMYTKLKVELESKPITLTFHIHKSERCEVRDIHYIKFYMAASNMNKPSPFLQKTKSTTNFSTPYTTLFFKVLQQNNYLKIFHEGAVPENRTYSLSRFEPARLLVTFWSNKCLHAMINIRLARLPFQQ